MHTPFVVNVSEADQNALEAVVCLEAQNKATQVIWPAWLCFFVYPQGNSNPCRLREREVS
jgi:hypothetical protein